MSGQPDSSVLSLVSALADAIGQPVQLDARGECVMEFAGLGDAVMAAPIEIVVARSADPGVLSIRSALIEPGQALETQMLEAALSLNYTRVPPGYSIAFDSVSRQLVLVALIDAERVSNDEFLHVIAGFLDLIPQLREECAIAAPSQAAHQMFAMGEFA